MLKIWDARNMGEELQSYFIGSGITNVKFSQKNLLAVSLGNSVEVCITLVVLVVGPYHKMEGLHRECVKVRLKTIEWSSDTKGMWI